MPKEQVLASDWFCKTIQQDGKVHFSGAYTDPLASGENRKLYSSSILIRDFSNPNDYIIVQAEYNLALFETIGKNKNISENSQLVILDASGQLVYTSDSAPIPAFMNDPAVKALGGNGTFWNKDGHNEKLVTYTQSDYSNCA